MVVVARSNARFAALGSALAPGSGDPRADALVRRVGFCGDFMLAVPRYAIPLTKLRPTLPRLHVSTEIQNRLTGKERMNISESTLQVQISAKLARSLDDTSLQTIFHAARTANGFLDVPVSREQLGAIVRLSQLGPTSANSQPARYLFVESRAGKERLKPSLAPGNVHKVMGAPVTAIVAADSRFYEHTRRTFPSRPEMADRFTAAGAEEFSLTFARDNSILQLAYFIIAARALGLDAGPLGGFDSKAVDATFFPDGRLISTYLVNVGYGDDAKTFPRLPRLDFDEIAQFA